MIRAYENKAQCCGCGACMAACPWNAIDMVPDKEGFYYPRIKAEKCTHCRECESVCPLKNAGSNRENQIYVGAQAKDDRIRFSSTSGGFFPVLARYILEQEGVVFGAAMGKNGRVDHIYIQDIKELPLLLKTKYVQSNTVHCFEKVKGYLQEGKQVLFTGTPCQCQAMKRYIGKENEKLLLVDLICYGVPSPEIWKTYIQELEKKYHGKFSAFSFRDKRRRDNGHTVSVQIGKKEYAYPMNQDVFCRLYFYNCIIRPSCYTCRFCTTNRESDITMGDFWGIEKVKPEIDDGMGTSLVILHNEKALHLWEAVKEGFRYFQCEREEALQPRLCVPTKQPGNRKLFFLLSRFMTLNMAEKVIRRRRFL